MDDLVTRLQANDPRAYEALIEQYADRLYRVAYRVLGDPDDAEDAVQETFLAVYRNIHTFRGEAKFSSWLYRIAYNQAVALLRRRQRAQQVYLDDMETDDDLPLPDTVTPLPEEALREEEIQRCLHDLLMELSPKLRAAFVLHEIEGLPIREVAEILGLKESAVKMRLHRARLALQQRLLQRWQQRSASPETSSVVTLESEQTATVKA